MERPPTSYDTEVKNNYSKILREVNEKELKGVFPDRLHFGPVYNAITDKGLPIYLKSFLINPVAGRVDPVNIGQLKVDKTILVIAFDSTGEITGHRAIRLLKQMPGSVEGRSDIATRMRGQGLAKWLDLAAIHLLKIDAANKMRHIFWEVENGNLARLRRNEGTYNSVMNGENPVLEGIKREQLSWRALYGPEGKLGFNQDGRLRIDPEEGYLEDVELMEQVNLNAKEINIGGRNIIVPGTDQIVRVSEAGRKALRDKNLRDFAENIYPKIEDAIKEDENAILPAA